MYAIYYNISIYYIWCTMDPSWDPKPRPSVEAPFCELQSHGAPVQLRPAAGAAAGILTLSSGELRITGCLGGNRVGVVWWLTGAFYVGNGWVAGGCWDDYWYSYCMLLWIVPENSLRLAPVRWFCAGGGSTSILAELAGNFRWLRSAW